MRKLLLIAVACSTLAGLAIASLASAPSRIDVPIAVAPHTLQLGTVQSRYVVVHAEIAYSQVNKTLVYLEGIPAHHTKADNRGELVAYFSESVIKSLVAPPTATLKLTGMTTASQPFSGTDTVNVVQHAGS